MNSQFTHSVPNRLDIAKMPRSKPVETCKDHTASSLISKLSPPFPKRLRLQHVNHDQL